VSNVVRSLVVLPYFIYLLAFFITAGPFAFFLPPESVDFFQYDLLNQYGGTGKLLTWQKLSGFFVAGIPALLLLLSMIYLLRLIAALKAGLWFDEYSELLCRRFGRALLWYVATSIVHRTLLVFILTATYPPGEHQFHVSFSNQDLMALVPAIFAMIFAHILGLARVQHEELQQIV